MAAGPGTARRLTARPPDWASHWPSSPPI